MRRLKSSGPGGLCAIDSLVREDVPVCTSSTSGNVLSVTDIKQSSRPPNRSSRVRSASVLPVGHLATPSELATFCKNFQPNVRFGDTS